MSDALEQELRAALADRARELPAADTHVWLERLVVSDRRPGRGVRRAPWLAAGIAVAAASIAAILLLSAGSRVAAPPVGRPSIPAAFLGWTPKPNRVTAQAKSPAVRCRYFASHKARLGVPIIDARGPYTGILYVDQRDNYERFCIYGPNVGDQGSGVIRWPYPGTPPLFYQSPGSDGIQDASASGSCGPGGEIREMHGRVGTEVVAAAFEFSNGASVRATVKRGFYLVWWPWGLLPKTIVLSLRGGGLNVVQRHSSRDSRSGPC